ncbi:MAG: hypothetical protein OXU20_05900 [Myxococcales bacterium]|nr:hypothetical protein [Myxococcales bacterium]
MDRSPGQSSRWLACSRALLGLIALGWELSCAAPIRASDASPRGHTFELEVGGGLYQLRDEGVAPLRWAGPAGQLGLRYVHAGRRARHQAGLRVPVAFLSNRYEHGGLGWEFGLGYQYLHRLGSARRAGPGGAFYLGAGYGFRLAVQELDWDVSHYQYLNAHELDAAVRWERPLGDHAIFVQASAALIALVGRPPAQRHYDETLAHYQFTESHENLVFTGPHEYPSITVELGYLIPLGRRWRLGTSYRLDSRNYFGERPIRILDQTLVLCVAYSPWMGAHR